MYSESASLWVSRTCGLTRAVCRQRTKYSSCKYFQCESASLWVRESVSPWVRSSQNRTTNIGHMEKQEMEMKWKLETETGNWKTEMETQPLSCCSHSNVVGFHFYASVYAFTGPSLWCNVWLFSISHLGNCSYSQQYSIFGVPYLVTSWFCINMPCTCPESTQGLGMKP